MMTCCRLMSVPLSQNLTRQKQCNDTEHMQKISMKYFGLRLSRSPDACFVQLKVGTRNITFIYNVYVHTLVLCKILNSVISKDYFVNVQVVPNSLSFLYFAFYHDMCRSSLRKTPLSVKGCNTLAYYVHARHSLWPMSREGSLSCHNFCDDWCRILRSYSKNHL